MINILMDNKFNVCYNRNSRCERKSHLHHSHGEEYIYICNYILFAVIEGLTENYNRPVHAKGEENLMIHCTKFGCVNANSF